MSEEFLYAQTVRDHADRAEFWARRSQRAANWIDLPAVMGVTLALSLLSTCLIVSLVKAQLTQQVEAHYAQCKR